MYTLTNYKILPTFEKLMLKISTHKSRTLWDTLSKKNSYSSFLSIQFVRFHPEDEGANEVTSTSLYPWVIGPPDVLEVPEDLEGRTKQERR